MSWRNPFLRWDRRSGLKGVEEASARVDTPAPNVRPAGRFASVRRWDLVVASSARRLRGGRAMPHEIIDTVLGGLFVLYYSGRRFNTPSTNRSSTTWGRFFHLYPYFTYTLRRSVRAVGARHPGAASQPARAPPRRHRCLGGDVARDRSRVSLRAGAGDVGGAVQHSERRRDLDHFSRTWPRCVIIGAREGFAFPCHIALLKVQCGTV